MNIDMMNIGMTGFGVATPLALCLLPLALAPLAFSALRPTKFPSIDAAPQDVVSNLVAFGLRAASIVAIGASVLAAASPYREGRIVHRSGEGAEIAILIDRSASMNETFAGRQPSGEEESKAAAAKRILDGFIGRRAHDLFGVTAFSTSPMLVMPMTDRREAVRSAIAAIDRPGLGYTNIGRGLAMALSMFGAGGEARSRVILLVSDGAAVIDPRIQDELRADFRKIDPNLYWLFLRTAGAKGIGDRPKAGEDTPQAMPERHLDLFFKSLGVDYRAFEAEGPAAVEEAIAEIDRLERHPIRYADRIPREDLTDLSLAVAAVATLLLLAAKFTETGLNERPPRAAPRVMMRRGAR
jgi:mxaC protein